MSSNEDIEEFISSLGKLTDVEKIEFLVRRKFPGYNTLPPTPILHSRVNPATVEAHKEQIKQGNAYKDELKVISRDNLEALWLQDCLTRAEERKLEEDNRFFNRSSAAADPSWKHAALVTIEEAIALAFNKDPEIVDWKGVRPYVDVSPFAKRYKRLRNLAVRAVAAKVLPNPVVPKDFAIWLKSIRHDLLNIFTNLLQDKEELPWDQALEPAESVRRRALKGGQVESAKDSEELPWIKSARQRANGIKKKYPKRSQVEISKNVHEIMKTQNITGRGGKVPSAASIKRHALKGLI